MQQPAAGDLGGLAGASGMARGPQSVGPFMMGDFLTGGSFTGPLQLSGGFLAPVPTPPNGEPVPPRFEQITVPYGNAHLAAPFAFRTFKIADNESPWPRNRWFFTTNYFNNVGDSTAITRQMLGFERTTADMRSSIGFRLPYYTVDPSQQLDPFAPSGQIGTFGRGTGTRGDIGDFTIILKRAVIFQPEQGNVLSGGLAVVTPTGPTGLGGVTPLYSVNGVKHKGSIQPWAGFYRSFGEAFNGWFLQGFSSIDAPFSVHDATFWYNDLGLGYYLRRDVPSGLTGIVPTVEAHVNTPLGNRFHTVTPTPAFSQFTGFQSIAGQLQYSNQVNITSGATLIFNRRTTLSFGVVVPVGSPSPFNYELLAQLNVLRMPWFPAAPPSSL